jgi:hypothetical protein
MSESTAGSPFARLRHSIGGSAEYVVALGLLLVCLAVGLAVWLSGGESNAEPAQPRIVAPGLSTVDERVDQAELEAEMAALRKLQSQLQASMGEVEAQAQQEFEAAEAQRLAPSWPRSNALPKSDSPVYRPNLPKVSGSGLRALPPRHQRRCKPLLREWTGILAASPPIRAWPSSPAPRAPWCWPWT